MWLRPNISLLMLVRELVYVLTWFEPFRFSSINQYTGIQLPVGLM